MNPEDLGKLITNTDEHRDAIHIAVAPMLAGSLLYPSQRIAIKYGTHDTAVPSETPVGLVDPYLKEPVHIGQRFWMFLYPGSITALRHEWTHPVLDSYGQQTAAAVAAKLTCQADIDRMTELADELGETYDMVIQIGHDYLDSGEYFSTGTSMDDTPGWYWESFEKITGRKVPDDQRNSFFSCSC